MRTAAGRFLQASGSFNPFAITWHSAWWASDPAWTNPGDGNSVGSWRDGSGNGHTASQSTGASKPTFRAATSALANKATVQGDGNDYLETASFTSLPGPLTGVVVGAFTSTAVGQAFLDGPTATSTNRLVIGTTTGPSWLLYAGTVLSSGTADTNGHLWRGYVTDAGAGDVLAVDGTTLTTGNAGTTGIPVTKFDLFANGGGGGGAGGGAGFASGHIAFAGVYSGDITTDAQWPAFKAWVRSYYGLTIA